MKTNVAAVSATSASRFCYFGCFGYLHPPKGPFHDKNPGICGIEIKITVKLDNSFLNAEHTFRIVLLATETSIFTCSFQTLEKMSAVLK